MINVKYNKVFIGTVPNFQGIYCITDYNHYQVLIIIYCYHICVLQSANPFMRFRNIEQLVVILKFVIITLSVDMFHHPVCELETHCRNINPSKVWSCCVKLV